MSEGLLSSANSIMESIESSFSSVPKLSWSCTISSMLSLPSSSLAVAIDIAVLVDFGGKFKLLDVEGTGDDDEEGEGSSPSASETELVWRGKMH